MKKNVAVIIVLCFLFSVVAPPFAQAYQLRSRSRFIEKPYALAYHKADIVSLMTHLLTHPHLRLGDSEEEEFLKKLIYSISSAVKKIKGSIKKNKKRDRSIHIRRQIRRLK